MRANVILDGTTVQCKGKIATIKTDATGNFLSRNWFDRLFGTFRGLESSKNRECQYRQDFHKHRFCGQKSRLRCTGVM